MVSSTHFPLLDEAVTSLCDSGQYQNELSDQELKNLILAVVHGILARYSQVRAEVLGLSVHMADNRGALSGAVNVTSPLTATITPHIVMVNDSDPSCIRLQDLQMKVEGGLFAKGMFGMLKIEDRVKAILADPTRALTDVLAPELRARGIALTGVGLHFDEDVLRVRLVGHEA